MQQFFAEISGAQLVHYEEAEQVLFVWHGGLCVTIYNDELVQLDCFNMMEASNVEQVRDAIRRHVDDYYGSLITATTAMLLLLRVWARMRITGIMVGMTDEQQILASNLN